MQVLFDTAAGLIGLSTSSGILTAPVPPGANIYRLEGIPSGSSTIVTLFVNGVLTLGPSTAPINTGAGNGWAFGDLAGGPQGVDLNWDYITIINGGLGGIGQRNTDRAALFVNRATNTAPGALGLPGPFAVTTWGGSTLKLEWNGPPGMSYFLLAGPQFPAAATFGCTGLIDIGTPPSFTDVLSVFSPSDPFWGALFQLDYCGYSQQTFLIPPYAPSTALANVQGAILQPSGCSIVLTAAFYLSS